MHSLKHGRHVLVVGSPKNPLGHLVKHNPAVVNRYFWSLQVVHNPAGSQAEQSKFRQGMHANEEVPGINDQPAVH
jgi:hypothetical protein